MTFYLINIIFKLHASVRNYVNDEKKFIHEKLVHLHIINI